MNSELVGVLGFTDDKELEGIRGRIGCRTILETQDVETVLQQRPGLLLVRCCSGDEQTSGYKAVRRLLDEGYDGRIVMYVEPLCGCFLEGRRLIDPGYPVRNSQSCDFISRSLRDFLEIVSIRLHQHAA